MNTFYHALQGQVYAAETTELSLFMDGTITGIGNGNPGFPVAAKAKELFVHWGFLDEIAPGPWTLLLYKNESTVAEATFEMAVPPPPPPATLIRLVGSWSEEVEFAAGDSFYLRAEGPAKHFVLMRTVLRFEETCQQ